METKEGTVYHGQLPCQGILRDGRSCRNRAYYLWNGQYLCGVHSRKGKEEREDLPKDPEAKVKREQLFRTREEKVEEFAQKNREAGERGKVICTKMPMMKDPEHYDGFRKVFPNYLHAQRPDGFGCATLSPKAMGPIEHGQPGLPVAGNLENFHQGNKVSEKEVDEKGNPLPQFFETQKEMYQDPKPHRHKPTMEKKNIPRCSMWRRKDGSWQQMTYLASRQFYCTFYERIASTLPEFHQLKTMLDEGYNLQIVGYDGYWVNDPTPQGLERCYLDTHRPFGHELVLLTMLVLKPEEYPWRKYVTEEF